MSFSRYSLCLSYLIYKRGGSNVPTSMVVKEVSGFYISPITGNYKTPRTMLGICSVNVGYSCCYHHRHHHHHHNFHWKEISLSKKKSALFFPYHMQPNVPFPDALSSQPKSLLSFQWRAHPSFDITESAILNRVVGEGLFEELAFEKVLRKLRKHLQKMCSGQERRSTGQELDVESVCPVQKQHGIWRDFTWRGGAWGQTGCNRNFEFILWEMEDNWKLPSRGVVV